MIKRLFAISMALVLIVLSAPFSLAAEPDFLDLLPVLPGYSSTKGYVSVNGFDPPGYRTSYYLDDNYNQHIYIYDFDESLISKFSSFLVEGDYYYSVVSFDGNFDDNFSFFQSIGSPYRSYIYSSSAVDFINTPTAYSGEIFKLIRFAINYDLSSSSPYSSPSFRINKLELHRGFPSFTIDPSSTHGGSIIPSDVQSLAHGETMSFSFEPDPGYILQDVLVNDISIGAVSSYLFEDMQFHSTIHAVFEPIPIYHNIKPHATSGGSILPSDLQSIPEGESITFTIAPKSGYEIEDVLVNGVSVGPVESYTFENVTAAADIRATFKFVGSVFEDGTTIFKPEIFSSFTDDMQGFFKVLTPVLLAVMLPFLLLYILRRLFSWFRVT